MVDATIISSTCIKSCIATITVITSNATLTILTVAADISFCKAAEKTVLLGFIVPGWKFLGCRVKGLE